MIVYQASNEGEMEGLENSLDLILSSNQEGDIKRQEFILQKLEEREALHSGAIENLTRRVELIRERQKEIKTKLCYSVGWGMAVQMSHSLDPTINSLERMILQELADHFKDTNKLGEKLVEVQISLRNSDKQNDLFKINYG